ncbi:MAG: SDR family oxidoreductase [Bacteroidetes bacterium]|nr:SDR family oxidoreductase [Bacteroidota bacterium]
MKDKVVVITGATSGIGKAIAFTFGLRGSKIFITGRNPDALDQTIRELSAKQIIVRGLVADAGSEVDNKKTVEAAVEHFGQIDVLVCNAGVGMRALFEDLDLSVFNQVMNINFTGVVALTKFALPHILKSKGSIVGISSINGRRSTPARTAYSASKFAMEGFLESLRTEVMSRGVHVLSVCPGFTASNIRNKALNASGHSQGESPRNENKMMTAETVAELTYQAVVRRKRDLILTSQGKLAVFLNKWIPAVMDKLVYYIMSKEPDSPLKKS